MTLQSFKAEHRQRGVAKIRAKITLDGAGNRAATVVGVVYGKLVTVAYVPGSLGSLVDIIVRDQDGSPIVSLVDAGAAVRYIRPSMDITNNTGVAIPDALTATDTNRDIYVAGRVTVEAAGGAANGVGDLHLIFDEAIIVEGKY